MPFVKTIPSGCGVAKIHRPMVGDEFFPGFPVLRSPRLVSAPCRAVESHNIVLMREWSEKYENMEILGYVDDPENLDLDLISVLGVDSEAVLIYQFGYGNPWRDTLDKICYGGSPYYQPWKSKRYFQRLHRKISEWGKLPPEWPFVEMTVRACCEKLGLDPSPYLER